GDRVDGERRADGEEEVAGPGRLPGADEVRGDEGLPAADRGRLQDPAAGAAGRVLLAGSDPVERPLHRRSLAAGQAGDLAAGAVDLHDLGRVVAGVVVEAVHV